MTMFILQSVLSNQHRLLGEDARHVRSLRSAQTLPIAKKEAT
jgi:hypothetical protein